MPRMTIFRSSLGALLALALPAFVAAQGQQPTSHTVKKGDTLWDISRTYLGDPFLWPQIYRLNTSVVEDPHWIYPGEVLQLAAAPGQTAVPLKETPPPIPQTSSSAQLADTIRPGSQPPQRPVQQPPSQATITVVGQSEATEEEGMALFRRKSVSNTQNAFKTYREAKYHPLRPGEFYSAGFLTEEYAFTYGRLLGPVTPEQIESGRARAAVQRFTEVAVATPEGASYAVGDSLVVVDRREGPVGYGEILAPMGLIRVTAQNGNQAVGDVIAVYGPMREGQAVLPAEKFTDPGTGAYQPVSNGMEGRILAARDNVGLRLPQQVLFLDIGKRDGVALGDMFEARRVPGPQRRTTADAVDEVMATLQVVHLRDRTATVKVRNVVSPDVPAGTRVKLVAKLPS